MNNPSDKKKISNIVEPVCELVRPHIHYFINSHKKFREVGTIIGILSMWTVKLEEIQLR